MIEVALATSECRMLHRTLICLGAVAIVSAAAARDGGADLPRGVLTHADEVALEARIRARVVAVRRRPPPTQFVVPGGTPPITGAGLRAASGRVVTAAALVRDWPLDASDVVEVEVDGAWRPAAVGLYEAALGLAVLDVPGLAAPPGVEAPPVGAVFTGRPVYALEGAGLRLTKIGPAGTEQQAYYVWLEGATLPPGAPLFDAEARLISIVGLPSPTAGRALILPDRALRALFERSLDWIP